MVSPAAPRPHVLVAFNAPSLMRFGPSVRARGTIIYDSSVISAVPSDLAAGVTTAAVPFTSIAKDLGALFVKNIVALGALQGATKVFPEETFLTAVRAALKAKCRSTRRRSGWGRSWLPSTWTTCRR